MKPYVIGRGLAGQAICHAFRILQNTQADLGIEDPEILDRGVNLQSVARKKDAVLCVANPHGLHAETVVNAVSAGFAGVICEKPACVTAEELILLRENVKVPVAVLHGYRMLWGPRKIYAMIANGDLGQIISIEGRYWQSSAAERALSQQKSSKDWKNDPKLAGPYDVYLDLASHWVDLASYVTQKKVSRIKGRRSYVHGLKPNQEAYVNLNIDFEGSTFGQCSASKAIHGATNQLEIHIIGECKSLAWNFMNPDEILVGEGRGRQVIVRDQSNPASNLPPFHGAGWLEGYAETIRQYLLDLKKPGQGQYASLQSTLQVLEAMFKVEWVDH
jgi:predicted dehydrogenase